MFGFHFCQKSKLPDRKGFTVSSLDSIMIFLFYMQTLCDLFSFIFDALVEDSTVYQCIMVYVKVYGYGATLKIIKWGKGRRR